MTQEHSPEYLRARDAIADIFGPYLTLAASYDIDELIDALFALKKPNGSPMIVVVADDQTLPTISDNLQDFGGNESIFEAGQQSLIAQGWVRGAK